jgi:hypothetical protein
MAAHLKTFWPLFDMLLVGAGQSGRRVAEKEAKKTKQRAK